MDNAKIFLLKKIINHEEDGLKSLGKLNAVHIDDISKVMMDFLEESLSEIIDSLNNGETIDVNGKILSIKKMRKG